MTDRYLEFTHSSFGKPLANLLGLPAPPRLRRAESGWSERPLEGRMVLAGATAGAQLCGPMLQAVHAMGATVRVPTELPGLAALKPAASAANVALTGDSAAGEGEASYAQVFDASGIETPEGLRQLYDFFRPQAARIPSNGRVLILSRAPRAQKSVAAAAVARSLHGFMRSLAKEIGRKGATANLVEVHAGADAHVEGAMRFLLTEHSAFVSGQVLPLGGAVAGNAQLPGAWSSMLAGKTALVTGAARGIGAAIAEVLAREGSYVIGLDRPQEEGELAGVMARLGGAGLPIDISAADAGERIARELAERAKPLDLVVHNAGITRDKMLRNMPVHFWDQVLEINFAAILRVNEKLLEKSLQPTGRVVCISSIGGIAGNAGQTNYGATKAGVIGYVEALAPEMAQRGGAINAIAPGFIETQMTAHMPAMTAFFGRRLSSLSQGGLPQDIAEAVLFMGSPAAAGVNGQCLRVCGQNLVGA